MESGEQKEGVAAHATHTKSSSTGDLRALDAQKQARGQGHKVGRDNLLLPGTQKDGEQHVRRRRRSSTLYDERSPASSMARRRSSTVSSTSALSVTSARSTMSMGASSPVGGRLRRASKLKRLSTFQDRLQRGGSFRGGLLAQTVAEDSGAISKKTSLKRSSSVRGSMLQRTISEDKNVNDKSLPTLSQAHSTLALKRAPSPQARAVSPSLASVPSVQAKAALFSRRLIGQGRASSPVHNINTKFVANASSHGARTADMAVPYVHGRRITGNRPYQRHRAARNHKQRGLSERHSKNRMTRQSVNDAKNEGSKLLHPRKTSSARGRTEAQARGGACPARGKGASSP